MYGQVYLYEDFPLAKGFDGAETFCKENHGILPAFQTGEEDLENWFVDNV